MFTYNSSWTLQSHIYHPDSLLLIIWFRLDPNISENQDGCELPRRHAVRKQPRIDRGVPSLPIFAALHPTPQPLISLRLRSVHIAIFEISSEISIRIPVINTSDSVPVIPHL